MRHGDDPPDDRVVVCAVENGFHPIIVKRYKGEALGKPGPDLAGTVLYAGPFCVFEEEAHPVLCAEARCI